MGNVVFSMNFTVKHDYFKSSVYSDVMVYEVLKMSFSMEKIKILLPELECQTLLWIGILDQ